MSAGGGGFPRNFADLQRALQNAQQTGRRFGAGGGGPGGPAPRIPGAIIGIVLLGAGAVAISNSLFNVDGGHRAIKYTRIGGVKKEIYNEGILISPMK